jgi:DNA ligase-1
MAKREFLMQSAKYNPLKFKADGSYMSEKLDGVRSLWMPWTRGKLVRDIPFANTLRDHENRKDLVCSGLWSRLGKTFAAPDWFLDRLPQDTPLDGELWTGRNEFQKALGIVREHEPNHEKWKNIKYMLFDIPNYQEFMKSGLVKTGGKAGEPAFEVYFSVAWAKQYGLTNDRWYGPRRFSDNLAYLRSSISLSDSVGLVEQTQLSFSREVTSKLAEVCALGAEGVMLRRPHSEWEVTRSKDLVKVKPEDDDEAVVTGYKYGNGRLTGMIGALRVIWKGITFDVGSGLTDPDREVKREYQQVARESQDEYTYENVSNKLPLGCKITFKYTGLTLDGIPRFGTFWRKFEE